jgi:hypothetical protein
VYTGCLRKNAPVTVFAISLYLEMKKKFQFCLGYLLTTKLLLNGGFKSIKPSSCKEIMRDTAERSKNFVHFTMVNSALAKVYSHFTPYHSSI